MKKIFITVSDEQGKILGREETTVEDSVNKIAFRPLSPCNCHVEFDYDCQQNGHGHVRNFHNDESAVDLTP